VAQGAQDREPVGNLDAAAALKNGILIVGEGVSFKEELGLAAVLNKLAMSGVFVLCLAPAGGEVVIPGLAGPAGGQTDLAFRREPVRFLDKRLDPDGWPANGKTVASTVAVKVIDDGVGGEVSRGPGGWPWVEARYAPGKGRWAVCGLALIAGWNDGPTPRFLFARMLDYLTETEPKNKGDEK